MSHLLDTFFTLNVIAKKKGKNNLRKLQFYKANIASNLNLHNFVLKF